MIARSAIGMETVSFSLKVPIGKFRKQRRQRKDIVDSPAAIFCFGKIGDCPPQKTVNIRIFNRYLKLDLPYIT